MKRCRNCGLDKPVAAFVMTRYGKPSSWCRACTQALTRDYRARVRARGWSYYRPPIGEKHWKAKLDNARVKAIRAALAAGQSCAAVGRAFGVSRQTVSMIKNGATWTQVE